MNVMLSFLTVQPKMYFNKYTFQSNQQIFTELYDTF